MRKDVRIGPFRITQGRRNHPDYHPDYRHDYNHDYRLDAAWTGDYLMRLPDRRLVKLADFRQKLEEYTVEVGDRTGGE